MYLNMKHYNKNIIEVNDSHIISNAHTNNNNNRQRGTDNNKSKKSNDRYVIHLKKLLKLKQN